MKTVVVITPPVASAVSYETAKAHLRVDHDDDKAMIEGLIASAIQHIDGPAGWLGRALVQQTLELRLDCFPWGEVQLPCPPYLSGLSVKYDDADGVEQTVDPAVYRVVGGGVGLSRLQLAYGQTWPAARTQSEAVRVRYDAGYGTAGEDVPAPITRAILLHIGALYDNREALTKSDGPVVPLPMAYEALLAPYRIWL